MRIALFVSVLMVATATLAGAAPYYSSVRSSPPPPPPASASDLLRAKKLADQARQRLEPTPRRGNGWVHGDPRR